MFTRTICSMVTAVTAFGGFLGCERKQPEQDYDLLPVMVVSGDLPAGTVLDYDLLAKFRLPAPFVTPGILNPDQVEEAVGRRLLVDLKRGDVLYGSLLGQAPGSSPPRHSNVIRKRLRTITVQAEGGSRVRPGDHVDVLLTIQDEKTGEPFSFHLFENVFALEAGASLVKFLGKERAGPLRDRISLMLLPDEARILALASRNGTLHVAIRNPEEPGPVLPEEGTP